MNTNKAALQAALVFLKVLLVVAVILGILFLGKSAYEYSYEAMNHKIVNEQEVTGSGK